jgi:hypothetical protein
MDMNTLLSTIAVAFITALPALIASIAALIHSIYARMEAKQARDQVGINTFRLDNIEDVLVPNLQAKKGGES